VIFYDMIKNLLKKRGDEFHLDEIGCKLFKTPIKIALEAKSFISTHRNKIEFSVIKLQNKIMHFRDCFICSFKIF
jgi:hypothetical protein